MTKLAALGTEGSQLNGIQVLSPADAWAVGQTPDSNGAILSLTEQFNGKTSWAQVVSNHRPRLQGASARGTARVVVYTNSAVI
jgi:hypothetical protein